MHNFHGYESYYFYILASFFPTFLMEKNARLVSNAYFSTYLFV